MEVLPRLLNSLLSNCFHCHCDYILFIPIFVLLMNLTIFNARDNGSLTCSNYFEKFFLVLSNLMANDGKSLLFWY